MLLYTDKLAKLSVMASACSESIKKAVITFPLLKGGRVLTMRSYTGGTCIEIVLNSHALYPGLTTFC